MVPAAVPVTLIGRFWRRNGRLEGDLEHHNLRDLNRVSATISSSFRYMQYEDGHQTFLQARRRTSILAPCVPKDLLFTSSSSSYVAAIVKH
ncbi:hypothetical protein HanRHA438_Chr09g0415481 [Helianthus annuus]|uniref:Uncharacterized protein n=1 Tax=Helianthus annuus TaxID=4232 RepID=A0A251TY11_HELAN|nr:hypothetical protein HanXRQr2_Chr09g0403591 [Helianthus annuus]KAJ0543591.1 hypothetical protein HanHA89_Chr09g0352341 [Helianthus annuus]KAJ0630185.1 hypothetical protein HanHA300_Chr00c0427g0763511 [Helianthus annuus]KAJ0708645.1 hypothetical protein HanLR1_Chr09g0331651 [Helianthus annuus]KAJ0889678.1 hypothetical protein HanRHA438_Chr09g0415481 [Helianthus annuus]